MKTFLRITVAACALAAATATLAQEPAAAPAPSAQVQTVAPAAAPAPAPATEPQAAAVAAPAPATITAPDARRPRYGFGISTGLVPGARGRLDTQGLGISFAIFRGRLRIEPGLAFSLVRQEVFGTTRDSESFTLSGGLLYELARVEKSAVYAGGRLGLSYANYDGSGFGRVWASGESLAAVLGGEYLPVPFVSIGLEAAAGFSAYQPEDSTLVTYSAGTSAALILRFYVP